MSDSILYIVVAIIGFTAQVTAVIVASNLQSRNAAKAQKAAEAAALGVVVAQKDALMAQAVASHAARELVLTAKRTEDHLDRIETVSHATHKIVNNQRTQMLRVIARLAKRIAIEHPDDDEAQEAYMQARRDVADSEYVNDPDTPSLNF